MAPETEASVFCTHTLIHRVPLSISEFYSWSGRGGRGGDAASAQGIILGISRVRPPSSSSYLHCERPPPRLLLSPPQYCGATAQLYSLCSGSLDSANSASSRVKCGAFGEASRSCLGRVARGRRVEQ
jgi:hypothetical protein